jgi:RTC4-like domain
LSRLVILQEDQDGPASSASSVNTSTRLFEETPEPEEPSKKAIALSSPPTSPEVVDVDEATPDPSQPTVEHSTISCPVCHQDVDSSHMLPSEKHPRLLSLKKQQAFCRRHQLNDAQNLLKQRDYPNVDWEVLALERIPKYVDHLQGVLSGKVKCYYADQLNTAVTEAKGNRRAIREYLTEGALDIVKPGYYGPKGSTVMMGQIISRMSKDINSKLEDKLMRAAGMGNYVAAVLVPELTLRLVMEDLSIKDDAEGRKVLDESTGVGLLLNPDDDHVD